MKYLVKEINNLHVTWLAGENRYILFREPAFRVFRLWMANTPEQEIIDEIAERYHIPLHKGKQFAGEIICQIRAITDKSSGPEEPAVQTGTQPPLRQTAHERIYEITGSIIRISYGNDYIESVIHPKLQHLAIIPQEAAGEHISTFALSAAEVSSSVFSSASTISLSSSEGSYHLTTSNPATVKISFTRIEEMAGAVYLEMLNIMYGAATGEWMGVAHASAITDGEEAILFVAPSGGGKSTIAALMVGNGYELLSDDFVPIALSEPEIHQFPAGISVRKTAVPFLKEYFPILAGPVNDNPEKPSGSEIYLPFPVSSLSHQKVKAKAVIFVHYDKTAAYRLKKESNPEMMNQFLGESWIANNPEAASRFMDWYFNLQVYTLRYSNNKKVVAGIKRLFRNPGKFRTVGLQGRYEHGSTPS